MKTDYKVLRPPLAKNYELPTRKELLKLGKGDSAKITFQVGDDMPERLWVILRKCDDPEEWTGITDNEPSQETTAKVLPPGTEVRFHPLDIIAVW